MSPACLQTGQGCGAIHTPEPQWDQPWAGLQLRALSSILYPVPLSPPLQVSSGRSPSTNDFIRIAILGSASREPNLRQFGLKIAICFLKYFHKLLWSFFCCSFSLPILNQMSFGQHPSSPSHTPLIYSPLGEVIPKKDILIFSFICLNIKVRHFQALVSLDLFQDVSLGFESFLKCPVPSVVAGHRKRWEWGGINPDSLSHCLHQPHQYCRHNLRGSWDPREVFSSAVAWLITL